MSDSHRSIMFAIPAYWLLEKLMEIGLAVAIAKGVLGEADDRTVFWAYYALRVVAALIVGLGVGIWEKGSAWMSAAIFGGAWVMIQIARDLRDEQESTWDDFLVGGLITFILLALPYAIGCCLTQRLRRDSV